MSLSGKYAPFLSRVLDEEKVKRQWRGGEGGRVMCSMNWVCQLMVLESLDIRGCQRPGVSAVRTDIGGWET